MKSLDSLRTNTIKFALGLTADEDKNCLQVLFNVETYFEDRKKGKKNSFDY